MVKLRRGFGRHNTGLSDSVICYRVIHATEAETRITDNTPEGENREPGPRDGWGCHRRMFSSVLCLISLSTNELCIFTMPWTLVSFSNTNVLYSSRSLRTIFSRKS